MKKLKRLLIKRFIKNFIPEKFQENWLSLISLDKKLDLIKPWDFWSDEIKKNNNIKEWNNNIKELKKLPCVKNNINNICLIIHFGNDIPKHHFTFLSDIINMKYYVFEGIVIVNEKFALVFNHDGKIIICNKN